MLQGRIVRSKILRVQTFMYMFIDDRSLENELERVSGAGYLTDLSPSLLSIDS